MMALKLGTLTDGRIESELVIRTRTSEKVQLKTCIYCNKYINICSRINRRSAPFSNSSKNIVYAIMEVTLLKSRK